MKVKRVLYIEDELPKEATRDYLWTQLTEVEGYEVVPARLGAEAEQHLRSGSFDLVILDIMMGAGNLTPESPLHKAEFFEMGLVLLKSLRKGIYGSSGTQPDVPVVVVSATNNRKRWEEVEGNLGPDAKKNWFQKPHPAKEIFNRIQEILQ